MKASELLIQGKASQTLGYKQSVGKVFVTVVIEGGIHKQQMAKNSKADQV